MVTLYPGRRFADVPLIDAAAGETVNQVLKIFILNSSERYKLTIHVIILVKDAISRVVSCAFD